MSGSQEAIEALERAEAVFPCIYAQIQGQHIELVSFEVTDKEGNGTGHILWNAVNHGVNGIGGTPVTGVGKTPLRAMLAMQMWRGPHIPEELQPSQ